MGAGVEVVGRALQGAGWALLPFALLPALVVAVPRLSAFALAFCDTIDAASRALGRAVKWLLPLLVLSAVVGVFALGVFGWASPVLDESAVYLHATALMLGMAPALLADEHVRVDVLLSRMAAPARGRVELVGFYVLLLPLMLAILWWSQGFTAFSWRILEGSPDAGGIRGQFLLKTLIPVFAVLMLAQGTSVATRAALAMRAE